MVFLHIVYDPQSQLHGNILPVDGLILQRVIDIGAVYRYAPAQKGQILQWLGQTGVNTPGGRDNMHPLLRRRFQRRHVFRRDVLFPVQQGAVKIEGNQSVFHMLTSCLFSLLKPKAPALASLFSGTFPLLK